MKRTVHIGGGLPFIARTGRQPIYPRSSLSIHGRDSLCRQRRWERDVPAGVCNDRSHLPPSVHRTGRLLRTLWPMDSCIWLNSRSISKRLWIHKGGLRVYLGWEVVSGDLLCLFIWGKALRFTEVPNLLNAVFQLITLKKRKERKKLFGWYIKLGLFV